VVLLLAEFERGRILIRTEIMVLGHGVERHGVEGHGVERTWRRKTWRRGTWRRGTWRRTDMASKISKKNLEKLTAFFK
jgi:hypothetical protein